MSNHLGWQNGRAGLVDLWDVCGRFLGLDERLLPGLEWFGTESLD